MIQEFREFLFRGNVIELAVAVVIGASFNAIVSSLVEDIITPLLGIFGETDFSSWTIAIGMAELRVGDFANALISFVLVASVIFFLVVKPLRRFEELRASREAAEEAAEPEPTPGPTELDVLIQIRDELRDRPA